MKQTLAIIGLFFALNCGAQTSYITATGSVVFTAGAIDSYDTPTIFVNGAYNVRQEAWLVTLGVTNGIVSASSPIKYEYSIRFTKSEIDAFTGSGTGDTAKLQNALDQAVKDYIETLNVSSTVTIH